MSKAAYLSYLKRRILKFETQMQADKKRLAGGSPRQKVEAAGELAIVEERLAKAKEKLARLEAAPAGAAEGLRSEIEEDFDIMEAAFDRWVTREK